MTEIEVKPEHAHDPSTRRVGILVAVVGIFLSVVTIASHRAHTDAVIHRTESNDLWSYYQAKKIREHTDEVAQTMLETSTGDPAKIAAALKKLDSGRTKFAADAEKLSNDARGKDKETELEERRALFFDIGEGLLELGLVLCSLYFLSRNAFFPVLGLSASIAGVALGIWGAFLSL